MRKYFLVLTVHFSLFAAFCFSAKATLALSNLGDVWTTGGIGDIHGLFPGGVPYGTDTARFTTGAGRYYFDGVTLEFEVSGSTGAGAWNYVNLQLYSINGASSLLLGSLGNPAINSTPTQWPQSSGSSYTTFVDFSSAGQVVLNPYSQYALVLSMPANSPMSAALMFTKSAAYTTPTDWIMGATTTGNPFANGEFLKLGVNATVVPEQSGAVSALICTVVTVVGLLPMNRRKSSQSQDCK